MKRKRGHKKGKSKKLKLQSPATAEFPNNDVESVNTEENNSGSEEVEENNEVEQESKATVEAAVSPIKVVEKPPLPPPKVFQRPPPTAVYGRVKLKLKKTTPKPPTVEPQVVIAASESQIRSDAGKSSEVVSVVDNKEDEVVVVGEKMEESSKKSGIIKIVSSKTWSPPVPVDKESGEISASEDSSKIVSLKSSSPPTLSSCSLAPDGRESGGTMVSLKSPIGEESGTVVCLKSTSIPVLVGEESSKIVSSKTTSPPAFSGKESSTIVSLKTSSSPAHGGKESGTIVSLEGSSPPALVGKENGKILFSTTSSSPAVGSKEGGKIVILKSPPSPTATVVSLKSSSPPALGSKGSGKIVFLKSSSPPPASGKESGVNGFSLEEEENKTDEHQVRKPQREVKYNKEELEASIEVIKKVMKMDTAEPFNVPVDPIKLGIPDYFDVIDTPMDFGTIRNNLENGTKYMDSEDVYKDVQYIWDNCFKYNNKGDYIVDLMKRVKKNFMKYWMAAGLYTEQTKKIKGEESSPLDESMTTGHGKKLKKGKGVKRHKDDCLCAICIMKRRRREREAREAQMSRELGGQVTSPQIKASKTGLPEEYKQEEISHAESPVETSSYMETSPDGDIDVEMEDGETRPDAVAPQHNNDQKLVANRADLHDKSDRSGDISEKSVQSDKGDAELYSYHEANGLDESGSRLKTNAHNQLLLQPEGQTAGYLQHRHELLEMEKKHQKLRMLDTFRDLENPRILGLCGTLFPNNVQTIWNGANSLVRCQRSCHGRGIHDAVGSFMNLPSKSASFLK
ncbi:hypothetical protein SOVF_005700 [Spinacia oleracea]|uniref:Bromo domain-containing protein n=1 Tax=Spinacia oleracea TaxID=3562 RepID=A0A9R0J3I7_SPIOL|nr:uncharacterized protein LOC110799586 [Spinacia oleracea]KNA25551.1 hypothetical protein SOVF_005700 [Spinacia oleracea]